MNKIGKPASHAMVSGVLTKLVKDGKVVRKDRGIYECS